MAVKKENYSFRKTWNDFFVDEYEKTISQMTDFHSHDYYEISVILSGEVEVTTGIKTSKDTAARAVISPPLTPHLITCTEGTLYKRINVVFSREHALLLPDGDALLSSLPSYGGVLDLESGEAEKIAATLRDLGLEKNPYRQRLLLAITLSRLIDKYENGEKNGAPEFVSRALVIIGEKYRLSPTASEIAREVGVSRTTLLTAFKKYTGQTLGSYMQKCKLMAAISAMKSGESEYAAAEKAGFGEASSLIRAFKARFGLTPKKYLISLAKN